MLTDALKVLVYELFLEAFYGKMTNQLIFFITFYIFHESDIKTSLI